MADRRIHAIDDSTGLSWVIADTTELAREGVARHQCGRSVGTTLSKMLTGALLMGSGLKDGEKQSLQLNSDGKLRTVIAEAYSDGGVRGYPSVGVIEEIDDTFANHVTCLGTAAQVGVVKSREGEILYSGSIELTKPSVPKAINEYLNNSEQLFSAVEIYTHFKDGSVVNAQGVIVRLLPGGHEAAFKAIQERFTKQEVFELFTDQAPIEETLKKLAPDIDLAKATETPIRFDCPCSRERVVSMLLSLGKEELQDILEKDQETSISCHFCGTVYAFDADDLKRFIADFDMPRVTIEPLTAEEEAELDEIEAKVKAQQAAAKAKEADEKSSADQDD